MKKWITLIIILLTFKAFAFEPIVGPWKVGKSDSGVQGPSYADMKKTLQTFVNNNQDYASLVNLGESEDGTETLGVLLYNKNITPSKLIVITGATHGNEYLNIVDRLAPAFLDDSNQEFFQFYQRGGAIFVLPVFNPYGYSKRRRYNTNGKDLNRDYSNVVTNVERFTQKETQNISSWVDQFISEKEAEFVLSMDYHCCYYGALLFPWAYTKKPIVSDDRQDFETIGQLMTKYFPGARYGAASELIWYLADGTSQDYWYAKYDVLAFTYEGRYRSEPEYLDKHIAWWAEIVNKF